jgi:hypothetical protein
MLMHSIELEIAQHQLNEFEALDPVIAEHREAMDCLNCESFLQKGIYAYRWLERFEKVCDEADSLGMFGNDQESAAYVDVVRELYKRWLTRGQEAEKWIAQVEERGFCIDNVEEFRACCSLVSDWVDRDSWYLESKKYRNERLAEN